MDAWSFDLVVSLESWVDFWIENAFFLLNDARDVGAVVFIRSIEFVE